MTSSVEFSSMLVIYSGGFKRASKSSLGRRSIHSTVSYFWLVTSAFVTSTDWFAIPSDVFAWASVNTVKKLIKLKNNVFFKLRSTILIMRTSPIVLNYMANLRFLTNLPPVKLK